MTTRRSAGEGTEITPGPDGRYHAWLSMGVKTGGRRDRRHVSGKTRAEGRAEVARATGEEGRRSRPRCRASADGGALARALR